jgi:polyferredoxin
MKIRRWVQIGFFLLIASIAVNHGLAESGGGIPWLSNASLHAICPFGGVVTLYTYLTDGVLIKKVHESSLVMMTLVFIISILVGPAFCGWVCPLGTVQEWVGKLGRRIFGARYNRIIPKKADRALGWLRYGVLVWVLVVTATSFNLVFSTVDPYFALFQFWTGEVAVSALLILAALLGLSLIVDRPWCRYACPYGALLGLTNKIRIFTIQRKASTCIDCKKCDRACPMGVEVSSSGKVRDLRCISCMECISGEACPVPETVELKGGIQDEI